MPSNCYILLEDGSYISFEDSSGYLLLEVCVPVRFEAHDRRNIGLYGQRGTALSIPSVLVLNADWHGTTTIEIDGNTRQIHFNVPALDGAGTAQLILLDIGGNRLYESLELATGVHALNVERALLGMITLLVECNAFQSVNRRFWIHIYYE